MLLDYNVHIELFLIYRKCYVSRMMYLYVGKEIKGTLETRKEEENKNDWGREGERSNIHKIICLYFSPAWNLHLYLYLVHHYQKQATAISVCRAAGDLLIDR